MRKRLLGLLMLLATAVGLTGCGGMFLSGAQPMTPPSISNLQLEPTRLRFTGGQVTVSVQVRDDNGVRAVTLLVVAPDGARSSVAMDSEGQDIFRATLNLSPNIGTNVQRYQLTVEAEDIFGIRAQSSPLMLEVEGLELPPGEPPI
jgi:hypothetical protein